MLGLPFALVLQLAIGHAQGEQDAAFEKVLTLATERSPELKIAESELKQRNAAVFSSWARWLPRVDLSLSESRGRDYSLLDSGSLGAFSSTLTPALVEQKRWALDLAFPIFRRSIWVGIQEASAQKKLAYYQSLGKMREFNWKMHNYYGDYLVQLYKVTALQTSIELAKTNFKEARLRFELGDRTRVDVLRAESNLASLESKLIDSQAARELSLNALLEYSGLALKDLSDSGLILKVDSEEKLLSYFYDFINIDHSFSQVEPYLPQQEKQDDHQGSFQQRVTENSPSYLTAIAQEDLGIALARQLSSAEWPELSAHGSYNKQGPDWNQAFANDNRSYSLALVLTIPIFTGGRIWSSHAEHFAAAHSAELERERQTLRLLNELENDRWRTRALKRSVESQRLNLSRNDEIVRLTLKSYQLGKATLSDLLLSQNDLFDTKTTLAQNELELMNLLRKLSWNLGLEYP